MFGYSNPVGASILILLGIVFAVLGIGGTAKVQIEGLGDVTLAVSGIGGVIL
jgi:hypothetical protein